MRLVKIVCSCFVAFVIAGNIYAKETNIAFVDGRALLQKYQGDINAKLQGEFDARKNEIISLQKQIDELSNKLKKDSAVLSSAQTKKMHQDLDSKQRDFQRLSTAYQEDINIRGNEELHSIGDKIQSVINDVAKEKHFDIVMQKEAAIFVDLNYDVTTEVLKRLDKVKVVS